MQVLLAKGRLGLATLASGLRLGLRRPLWLGGGAFPGVFGRKDVMLWRPPGPL